jgi:topoisomerase-4 subunit A
MSQGWAYRYPLIDFQGNNGSIDGDGPAAYRYTEARLSALSNELLSDIDEDTVKMDLTFDDTLFEPDVLPARFPNLLVNGSEGIAVGIATSIPPHNLKEVTQAIIYRIKHPNCEVEDLLKYIPGPDFPTGGIIYESDSLKDIYRTGHGKVCISSRCTITTSEDGVPQIIVSEIPYQVNKSELVKAIDKIRHDKTIPGIDEVRDETDKEGLRIAIDLKDDAKPEAILGLFDAEDPASDQLHRQHDGDRRRASPLDGSHHLLRLLHPASARCHHPPEPIPFQEGHGPSFDRQWPHQSGLDHQRGDRRDPFLGR